MTNSTTIIGTVQLLSCTKHIISTGHDYICGAGSVLGMMTGYELGGGVRDFPHVSRTALGPTQPPVQWARVVSGSKVQPGRGVDPSPSSSAVVKEEQSYTSTPPMGLTACTETQCLYEGAIYFLKIYG